MKQFFLLFSGSILVLIFHPIGESYAQGKISGKNFEEQTIELSLMTYNIQAAIHHAATVPTLENLEMIAKVIEREKPDILLLQEVMRFDPLVDNIDEFAWLKERLEYPDGVYASGRQDPVAPGTAEWGVAIYLKTGSIVSSEKHRLGNNRALLRVTASIQGSPIHFFCTHLGSGEIPRQAELVGDTLTYFTPLNEPIVLGGDFNAIPGASSLSPIREHLENIYANLEEQPIDSFFISSDMDVLNTQIVPDPTEASDHPPVVCTLKIPLYQKEIIMGENFDHTADLNKLNKSPWWTQFGGYGHCRYESMPGGAYSDPNVLYIMRAIASSGGEQFEWLAREPTPANQLRFTWFLKHNQDHVAKGSIIASASSSYQNAIVSWYDPDPDSTIYGIRCYNTFETGGNWSSESLSFNVPKYPKWNKLELLCKGTEQQVFVNNRLVGTWGPASRPGYDRFNLWQWGRCNQYENHNPADEGVMWIDNVSLKTQKTATPLLNTY